MIRFVFAYLFASLFMPISSFGQANNPLPQQRAEDFSLPVAAATTQASVVLSSDLKNRFQLPRTTVNVNISKQQAATVILSATMFGVPQLATSADPSKTHDLFTADLKVNAAPLGAQRPLIVQVPVWDLQAETELSNAISQQVTKLTNKPSTFASIKDSEFCFTLQVQDSKAISILAQTTLRQAIGQLSATLDFELDQQAEETLKKLTSCERLQVSIGSTIECLVGQDDWSVTASTASESLQGITNIVENLPGRDGGKMRLVAIGGTGEQRLAINTVINKSMQVIIQRRKGGHQISNELLGKLVDGALQSILVDRKASDFNDERLAVLLRNGLVLTGALAEVKKVASNMLKLVDAERESPRLLSTLADNKGVHLIDGWYDQKLDKEAVSELWTLDRSVEGQLPSFTELSFESQGNAEGRGITDWTAKIREVQTLPRDFLFNYSFGQIKTDKLQADFEARERGRRRVEKLDCSIKVLGDDKKEASVFVLSLRVNNEVVAEGRFGAGKHWDEGSINPVSLDIGVEKSVFVNEGMKGQLFVSYDTDKRDEAVAEFTVTFSAIGIEGFGGPLGPSTSYRYGKTIAPREVLKFDWKVPK